MFRGILISSWPSPCQGETPLFKVWFNKAPLPISVCSVLKEVIAEASEAHLVTVNLCTGHTGAVVLPQSCQKSPFFLYCVCSRPSARLLLGASN